MESLEALNRSLFLAINADPATSAWMLGFAKFLAKDTLYLLPLLLVGFWIRGGDAGRRLALKSVVATAVSLGIGTLIGLIYVHQRPFVLNIGNTYMLHKPDASFPSHHATIFAAIGFCLLAAETRLWGWLVLALGVAAGWARVYLGVHFPFDILGGFVVAYAGYFGVSIFWDKCWKNIHDKISKR